MIHTLLHARVLDALPPSGIIASPVYQPLLAFQSDPASATAVGVFTLDTDGTWTSDGTGYASESGTWYAPPTGGVGPTYEARITPTLVGGVAGLLANDAVAWTVLAGPLALRSTVQRFTEGTSFAKYSVHVELRIAGDPVVRSSGTFVLTNTATVGSADGGGCPSIEMWAAQGLRVGDLRAGQRIEGVESGSGGTLVRLAVAACDIGPQPCYRLVTACGAACVLSESTPFDLPDGSTRHAAQMLGWPVLRESAGGALVWDEVTACYPVGDLPCARVNVGGHSFLAGENPLMRILSHNSSKT